VTIISFQEEFFSMEFVIYVVTCSKMDSSLSPHHHFANGLRLLNLRETDKEGDADVDRGLH
jgi:hypothetical protein